MARSPRENLSKYTIALPDDGGLTLWQAQKIVRLLAPKANGIQCPCCGQLAKIYARPLHSTLARALIVLVGQWKARADWLHIKDLEAGWGAWGDFAKLKFWGFIEQRTNTDPAKKTSGYWRPTDKGIEAAHSRLTFPAKIVLYNDVLLGFAGKQIYIQEALGKKWRFDELMQEAEAYVIPVNTYDDSMDE